jgi:predicted enzyme related to lactoylglutathione lyase
MITGVHVLLYSADADADRAFLRDVLGWSSVPAGGPGDDWSIHRLPPGEAAVHPTDGPPSTSMYLLCDDLDATMTELASKGVTFASAPADRGWGVVTTLELPSGAQIGLYQPRHATAYDM